MGLIQRKIRKKDIWRLVDRFGRIHGHIQKTSPVSIPTLTNTKENFELHYIVYLHHRLIGLFPTKEDALRYAHTWLEHFGYRL